MIPTVFVSSTVEDLHHLRDSIRDALRDLGYNPVLSEYGDVGYSPGSSAEDSCYQTIKDCNLAILIVGKRYGKPSKNGLSVTHNEWRCARDVNIPFITLVDEDVLAFKRVFDANPSQGELNYPGVDFPEKAFGFIQEIVESPLNNGVLGFATVEDARNHLKKQIAHLFGNLLRGRFDPLKAEIKDVLSEIKTLRHELVRKPTEESRIFLRAIRFFLDDAHEIYRDFVEFIVGDITSALPALVEAPSFDAYLEQLGLTVLVEEFAAEDGFPPPGISGRFNGMSMRSQGDSYLAWGTPVNAPETIQINPPAIAQLRAEDENLRLYLTGDGSSTHKWSLLGKPKRKKRRPA